MKVDSPTVADRVAIENVEGTMAEVILADVPFQVRPGQRRDLLSRCDFHGCSRRGGMDQGGSSRRIVRSSRLIGASKIGGSQEQGNYNNKAEFHNFFGLYKVYDALILGI